jgi:hypothetical protein
VAAAPLTTLRVERLDGDVLELDGLGLAQAFFAGDPSSEDGVLGRGDRIDLEDVIAMNSTMRSRSPHRVWEGVVGVDAPWLAAIPVDLDLIAAGDRRWKEVGGGPLVAAALAAVIGPGRAPAVATKLLHLKRPRLFPMLDALVAEMLGASAPDLVAADRRAPAAAELVLAVRREGRRNLAALRAVQRELPGPQRSLVRIFDAILWLAHPAARVRGTRRVLGVRLDRQA